MLEWGIVHKRTPEELHRGPMTEEQAREWVSEWDKEIGNPGLFLIVNREVSPWRLES